MISSLSQNGRQGFADAEQQFEQFVFSFQRSHLVLQPLTFRRADFSPNAQGALQDIGRDQPFDVGAGFLGAGFNVQRLLGGHFKLQLVHADVDFVLVLQRMLVDLLPVDIDAVQAAQIH